MVCPHCGERIAAIDHNFCHACGARLARPPQALIRHAPERNLVAAAGPLLPSWRPSPGLRLVTWGAGAVLTVVVAVAVLVAVVTALAALVTAMTPLVVLMVALALASRSHRRRRRWVHF